MPSVTARNIFSISLALRQLVDELVQIAYLPRRAASSMVSARIPRIKAVDLASHTVPLPH